MDGLRRLLKAGSGRVRACLHAKVPQADPDPLLAPIRECTLPGLVAFLAFGQSGRSRVSSTGHGGDLTEEGIPDLVARVAETQGVTVTPELVRHVADLLLSGEWREDVAAGAALVLHAGPRMPLQVTGDLARMPEFIPALVVAIGRDLSGSPHLIAQVLTDLTDGRLDTQHHVMVHMLRAFFQFGTAESLVNLLRMLTGPEYEAFRLAVIVYAASNGIQVDAADLDRVRTALDPQHPDLGPLLESAFERLLSTYPEAQAAQRVLEHLAARRA